jgi:hypothetical protein
MDISVLNRLSICPRPYGYGISVIEGAPSPASFFHFNVLTSLRANCIPSLRQPSLCGINDLDAVSGSVQSGRSIYGFIRKPSGKITTFLVHGQSAYASKINNRGTIVGSYYLSQTSAQGGVST